MKKLEDHVKAFIIPIGKYKDLPLTEVSDLDWLDWYVNSDFSSKWQRKLVNWFIDDITKDLKVDIDVEKVVEGGKDEELYQELKNGAWVTDDNF